MHDFAPDADHVPPQITPRGLADYFEVITRAVINAGISWQAVQAKWAGFDAALAGFDPRAVADFDEQDVDRLATDERIIRNRRKLAGTVTNARTLLALADEHDGFAGWLHGHDGYDATATALVGEFRFVGDFGAYWILHTIREPVPEYHAWRAAHPVRR